MSTGKKDYIIFGSLFILLGIIGFAGPIIYEAIFPKEFSANEAMTVQLPTFDNFASAKENISPTPTPSIAPNTVTQRDHLIIASGKIDMPVFTGLSEKTLNKGGWLYPNSSSPDKGGNSVIFGHRYMYKPPKSNTFWNLDKVKIGDEMVLFWKGREYRYKVFETKVIEPTDLSVIQPTSDNRLTVITCTPLFTTKQRLVVTGILVSLR